MHIVFVTSAASKNVNEKIKTQTSSPPFVGGYMPKMLIWTFLPSYLRNEDPGHFKKVSLDQIFWFLEFLKICKNVLVKCNFSYWPSEKKSLKVPTNSDCFYVKCFELPLSQLPLTLEL